MQKESIQKIVYLLLCFFTIFHSCSNHTDLLPKHITTYRLEKKLEGEEARLFVDKLHFQKVAPLKTEIGFYKGNTGPATIYISFYANSELAENDFRRMTKKISASNSVFTGEGFIKINQKLVYRCFGLGQSHAVFSHNKLLFWVTMDKEGEKNLLDNYIDFLINNKL